MSNMLSKLKAFFLIAILFTLVACGGGVRFATVTPNLSLPPSYTTRSIYESGVAAYDFYDLVGNVLLVKHNSVDKPIRVAIARPSSYKDSVRMLTEEQSLNYYHSIITKGAQVQGNYLAFSAKFAEDQMAEYTLMDIAQSSIKFDQTSFTEIVNSLKKYVDEHPKKDTSVSRIWIKSVVLSSSLYVAGTKISANASGVVGNTLGVNGSVYNTNNQTIKGTIVGFDYFDVDELVGNAARGPLTLEKINALQNKEPLLLKGLEKAKY